jgi:hypothetical protein
VWSNEHASLSDDSQIKSRWPQCQEIQEIAANLFLVKGVGIEAKASTDQAEPSTITQEIAIKLAEEMLASARRANDRRREITAMTDLSIVFTRIGETDGMVNFPAGGSSMGGTATVETGTIINF